jgi:DNA-binding transcriptional ArsR family regulator
MLYFRLLRGPLWIGDWESTGLKSRSTVHKRLKYLKSQGLVATKRQGHRILYEILPLQNQKGAVTREGILWHSILYPVSRKEVRRLRREHKKLIKELIQSRRESTLGVRALAKMFDEIEKIESLPESKEICEILKNIGFDIRNIPLSRFRRFILSPNLNGTLCTTCLSKGEIVYLVFDNETGEYICPIEGIVV